MLSALYSTRARRDADGFTLIELLVVVIIIGLLAAIALPIFIDQTKTSVDASVKADVRNTVTNVTNAQAQATTFPTSAKAAISGAGTSIALVAATTEITSRSTTMTFANVPALGTTYSVHGWNAGGKAYQGTAANPAFVFNSASGQFAQGTGIAPSADGAAADPSGGSGSTGSSQVAPTWSGGSAMADGVVGTTYPGYTVTASGTPNPTYSASALTALGLTINATTGVIGGTPNASYNGNIVVTATNAKGSIDKTFTLKITAPVQKLASYDFESGVQSWSALTTSTSLSTNTVGTNATAALKQALTASSNGLVTASPQAFTLVNGASYTMTADIYIQSPTSNVRAFFYVDNSGTTYITPDTTATGSWQKLTYTFTATSDSATGRFRFVVLPTTGNLPSGSTAYVDNVTLIRN